MQGPKLKIVTECGNCKYLKLEQLYNNSCKKLNVKLQTNGINLPIPNENCPFLEENSITFHNESLMKISKNKEDKIENSIKTIFPLYKFHKLSINEIILATETITNDHIVKIQKEFPDYLYEIYVDDYMNLKLSLTKKLVKV